MLEPWQIALLALTGLAGGTLGGFVGIGGAVIFIPMMKVLLDENPHTVIATSLVLTVCVGLSSAVGHLRSGRVMGRVVALMVPFAMAAAVAGVHLGNRFTGDAQAWLWRLLGAFLAYVMLDNIWRLVRRPRPDAAAAAQATARNPSLPAAAAVGASVGFASGLLGIGGGSVGVPAQQVALRVPLRAAIANSSVMIVLPCAVAALQKHLSLPGLGLDPARPWLYVVVLAPTAIVGGLIGSHLVHHVPSRWVRIIFVLFLAWMAWRLLTAS